MNCGALRPISDEVHLQSTSSAEKMHSMPRSTAPPQTLHSRQNVQPNPAAVQSRSLEQQQHHHQQQQLRRSTMPRGRGLASCLRGERDDAPTPPIHEVPCDVQQLHHHLQHHPQPTTTTHPLQEQLQLIKGSSGSGLIVGEQERGSATGSGAPTLETAGRSEYKSKTLPRIHFDTALNDTSLNEDNILVIGTLKTFQESNSSNDL
ncbi:hypothetical protein KR054_009086 [Drosophila jambulina]|nr:hypothetical protein KR054_009086 [Drosophila jambulina]